MNQQAKERIPWPPVPMDDSPTLYPMDLDEFIQQSGVATKRLHDWHGLGLLSFVPDAADRFEEYHLAEVRVVEGLLETELSPAMINTLLEDLPKPYRYDPRRLCYNFFLRCWQMVPAQSIEQIRGEIRDDLECDIPEQVDAYIHDLAEDGNAEALEALKAQVGTAIEQAESTTEG